jgi:hypothetical protein
MELKNLPAPAEIPSELKELSRQIEQWRSTRPCRRPMPEPLWTLAANLARQYGMARVARCLRLDYYSLKEHIQPREEITATESRPTFIELPHLAAAPLSECTIELDHPRGSRMRIHIKGTALPDIAALTRTFYGMKR